MTNANNMMRALMVYALVLPAALVIGYMLTQPYGIESMVIYGVAFGVLTLPLLLKWHQQLLFFSWNTTVVIFFLPGNPNLWLVMAFLSLLIAIVHRTLVRDHRFLSAPSIVWPLVFITVVVAVTAKLTGFGLNLFGSAAVGGKRYLLLFAGVAGFLAMISNRIPTEKAKLFVGLFFLGQLTNAIGTFAPVMPKYLQFLFFAFPVESAGLAVIQDNVAIQDYDSLRPWGLTNACLAVCFYLLARFGIKGIFDLSHQWRLLLFVALAVMSLFGGYRSFLILLVMTCGFLFVLEGLVRTRYMIVLVMVSLVAGALTIPFASKLPMSIQRTLSFLPLDISPVARASAQGSTEWRIQMWQALWPEVPKYLLLGKGLLMDAKETQAIEQTPWNSAQAAATAEVASDFHNGPLSVLIPFGIFGALGFLWFVAAAMRAVHHNWKYGDPELKLYNSLLFAFFLAKIVLFMAVFGGFYSDLATFAGIVGLSIALNGGIRQPEHRRFTVARPVALSLGSPVRPTPSFTR